MVRRPKWLGLFDGMTSGRGWLAGYLASGLLLCFTSLPALGNIDTAELTALESGEASLTRGRAQVDRGSGNTTYPLTFTNDSGNSLNGPLYAELLGVPTVISPTDVSTDSGQPVVTFDVDSLAPGESAMADVVFAGRPRFNLDQQLFATPDVVVVPPPTVDIVSPAQGFLTNGNDTAVSGTIGASVVSVAVNGVPAALAGGNFSATVPLVEGNNTLTAVALNSAGDVASDSVVVVRDTTPPRVSVESPGPSQIVTSSTVPVVGSVNDIVTGTVNEQNCQVTVTGRAGTVTAAVANRTFQVEEFPLVPGLNTLSVTARDAAGNFSAPFEVTVERRNLVGQRLQLVSGGNQSAEINDLLANPVVVQALDNNGAPLPNRTLTFKVVRNNGMVQTPASPTPATQKTVVTDGSGQAAVQWSLGNRVGVGNNRLEVSGIGFPAPVLVNATAVAAPCTQIFAMSGENQVGIVGSSLARPFEVVAMDDGGNLCVGTPVDFAVQAGGGNIAGGPVFTQLTNADGRAAAVLTLGPTPGINNQRVTADFAGLQGDPATFLASAAEAQGATRFLGTVLDTTNVPIPNAHVTVVGTNLETFTDGAGQFVLDNVPPGAGLLIVDGGTTTRTELFPEIEFQIDVISGIDNTLGMPIFIPALDQDNFRQVGNQDVILEMDGVAGFSVKVFANSAFNPDGTPFTGSMGVTQVSNDQVPMPPSGGAAPPWVGTLQPAGVRLNPPAQLTVPNALGLPQGQIIDLFSFDHDLQQFVGVGTGTVQPGGATIVSDPGSGLIKSGWFFDCPPPPPTEEADNCEDPVNSNTVRDAWDDAFNNSNPGPGRPEDNPGRLEQGGWIVQEPDGSIRIEPWPVEDGDTIVPGPKPPGTIGGFHTHPNTGPEYAQEPSGADINAAMNDGVPCYVISDDRIYRVNPDGTVDDLGSRADLTSPTSCD